MDNIISSYALKNNSLPTFTCCVCTLEGEAHLFYKRVGWRDDKWIVCKECAAKGKHCSRCEVYMDFSQFPKSAGPNRGGVSSYCKSCMLVYKREYYKKHGKSEYTRARELVTKLKQYGLTLEQYKEMLQAQGGVCAACGHPETATGPQGIVWSLAVDHNHETGQVRQLLCSGCNIALGNLREDPERIQALLAYVLKWQVGT